MKKLDLINQFIALIFNSINLFKTGVITLAGIAAYYYTENTINVNMIKSLNNVAIKEGFIFLILSLIYVILNYLFVKKNMKKPMIILTIIGCISTIISLFITISYFI